MIDNQFVPKSSEVSGSIVGESNTTAESRGRIYFDTLQALAEFDAEAQQEDIIVSEDPRVATYQRNAQVLMKHREYPLALNLLRQASNIDSKNPVTLSLLVSALESSQRIDEALLVSRALSKIDYGFESMCKYATALYKLGKDQEALDKYYEALAVLTQENSLLFEVYKNMGNIFVRQGDFDGAEEYYNKAYTLNPESDILLVNLGTLEVQRNDFDKSVYCFRRAIEINADNDKAWVGLAMVHNHIGDAELAWANVERALDINPKNRTAVHLAANWGVRDQQPGRAIEALQNYLSSVEQDEDMSLVLINLFCMQGQFNEALMEIERVLLWNPSHQEVRELKRKLQGSKAA